MTPLERKTGMKKERKDHQFIKKPFYEGGITTMKAFIKKHLSYPTAALQKKIEGTVHIRYAINYRGKVVDAKIIAGIGHGCNEEAIRLVKLLVFNMPKNRNLKALFHKTLQIHFRLPKTTTKKVPVSPSTNLAVQYNYTVTKPVISSEPDKKKGKGGSYDITIKW